MDWTPEMVERLRSLHKDGVSATLSAKEFGCTRNAVIGKWNRLGWCNTRPRAIASRKKTPRLGTVKKKVRADILLPDFIPDPTKQCSILGLTAETCSWPIGDGDKLTYCGCKRYKLSYCAHHYGRSLARYAGVGV